MTSSKSSKNSQHRKWTPDRVVAKNMMEMAKRLGIEDYDPSNWKGWKPRKGDLSFKRRGYGENKDDTLGFDPYFE